MFYGSTLEHRQGSMISDPYESRHDKDQQRTNSPYHFLPVSVNIINTAKKSIPFLLANLIIFLLLNSYMRTN